MIKNRQWWIRCFLLVLVAMNSSPKKLIIISLHKVTHTLTNQETSGFQATEKNIDKLGQVWFNQMKDLITISNTRITTHKRYFIPIPLREIIFMTNKIKMVALFPTRCKNITWFDKIIHKLCSCNKSRSTFIMKIKA